MKSEIILTEKDYQDIITTLVRLPYEFKPIIEGILKFLSDKFQDEAPAETGVNDTDDCPSGL